MAGFRIAPHVKPEPTPARRPRKNADYLAFLHKLPCVLTGAYGVEAAHVSFSNTWHGHYGRAKGTKAPDRFALPLAPEQHALQHSGKLGSEGDFWEANGVNPHELANTLWGIFSDYEEDEAVVRCTGRINQGLALAGRLRERALS